eukprot:175605_1
MTTDSDDDDLGITPEEQKQKASAIQKMMMGTAKKMGKNLSELPPAVQESIRKQMEAYYEGAPMPVQHRMKFPEGFDQDDQSIPDDIFHWSSQGDVEKVRQCIASGIDVNSIDDSKMTPLHWAADSGHKDLVILLLDEFGASVDLKDADGCTPLAYACSCDHTEVAQILLKHNADISICDNEGLTPLSVAGDGIKKLLQNIS